MTLFILIGNTYFITPRRFEQHDVRGETGRKTVLTFGLALCNQHQERNAGTLLMAQRWYIFIT